MIFLTVGTHEPFERLIRAVDDWYGQARPGIALFAQVTDQGLATYRPKHFEAIGRLTPMEYEARFDQAQLIVSHAGMGSILTALSRSKPIVVMPRRGHLHETRNDHQFTTVQHLGNRPGVFSAKDETQIGSVLDRAVASLTGAVPVQIPDSADPAFTTALRDFFTRNAVGQ